jgi:hypothetical protein
MSTLVKNRGERGSQYRGDIVAQKQLVFALASALAIGSAGAAYAANVQFKQKQLPVFTDAGLSLSAEGALVGLGNQDLVILLTAKAKVTATCTNPSGANQPPGRNPAPITVSGSDAIPASEIKNGTVDFFVQTKAPVSPIPNAPDCPNRQWKEQITDLSFTSVTLTVQQPAGRTVLTATCVLNPPTKNGAVPAATVYCTTK